MNKRLPAKPLWIGPAQPCILNPVWLAVSEAGLVALEVQSTQFQMEQRLEKMGFSTFSLNPERVAPFAAQVCEYLTGERRNFSFPVDWSVLGPFQEQALRATFAIPYGQTRTYAQIAQEIGHPRAARAVGRAEATNPMPLVIPCHRVVGSDGNLHGYGAGDGLATKTWLLNLEGAIR